jgi:hypothetical protein
MRKIPGHNFLLIFILSFSIFFTGCGGKNLIKDIQPKIELAKKMTGGLEFYTNAEELAKDESWTKVKHLKEDKKISLNYQMKNGGIIIEYQPKDILSDDFTDAELCGLFILIQGDFSEDDLRATIPTIEKGLNCKASVVKRGSYDNNAWYKLKALFEKKGKRKISSSLLKLVYTHYNDDNSDTIGLEFFPNTILPDKEFFDFVINL